MTSAATSAAKRQKTDEQPEVFTGKTLPHQFISTWNNYSEDDIPLFRAWCEKRTAFSVVGREVGKQGTPHLQGFHQTSGGLKFAAFHKRFPKVWVKPVGKDNGCADYCQKDDDVCIRTGTYEEKCQGKRSDLAAVAELAASGASAAQIAISSPTAFIQYPTGIARLCSIHEKPRDRSVPKVCICLYGGTGLCKTKRIWDHLDSLGECPYAWDNGMATWWDGYNGQKHIIMDEFRAQLPMTYILRLMDRYPMRVQFKGGSCQFVADFLYFTSSKHPREWYADAPTDKVDQLLRRFEGRIYEITSAEQTVDLTK